MKFITTMSLILLTQISMAATIDVKLATEGAFMPWNFCLDANGVANNSCTQADVDAGQTLTGFDKDYGDALCSKMSELDVDNTYNCTWVVKPWSDLSTGLTLGADYDLIIAQMTDIPSRRTFADFVGPYIFSPTVKYISLAGVSVSMGGATKITPRTNRSGSTILDCPVDTTLKIGTQESTTHSEHVSTYCLNPLTTYATQGDADLDKNNTFADSLKFIINNAVNALFSNGTTRELQDMWE